MAAQTQVRGARRKSAESAPPNQSSRTEPSRLMSSESRRQMIREAAYWRAERRGFSPGFELEDWLAAEAEVDALLAQSPG